MIESGSSNYEVLKAFNDEFQIGTEDQKTSDENRPTVLKIEQAMKENYNWTDLVPPLWLGAHECSDMILRAGHYYFNFLIWFCLI